jgi:hypothetical protein
MPSSDAIRKARRQLRQLAMAHPNDFGIMSRVITLRDDLRRMEEEPCEALRKELAKNLDDLEQYVKECGYKGPLYMTRKTA